MTSKRPSEHYAAPSKRTALDVVSALTDDHRRQLAADGYAVIDSLLSVQRCEQLLDEAWQLLQALEPRLHRSDPSTYQHFPLGAHNILQAYGLGQARFLWSVRTEPAVLALFSDLLGTAQDQLLSSMDTFCLQPQPASYRRSRPWPHVDQSVHKRGWHCYQSLLNCVDTTHQGAASLVVVPGSHRIHRRLLEHLGAADTKDYYQFADQPALWAALQDVRRFAEDDDPWHSAFEPVQLRPLHLYAPAGSLMVWDSRTIHWSHHASAANPHSQDTDRLVIYLSYLPASRCQDGPLKPQTVLKQRLAAFHGRRTTSHWANKAVLCGLKPQLWGDLDRAATGDVSSLLLTPAELSALHYQLISNGQGRQ